MNAPSRNIFQGILISSNIIKYSLLYFQFHIRLERAKFTNQGIVDEIAEMKFSDFERVILLIDKYLIKF